ncbi:MAG: ABC transporter permease [Trueperaceae bacterium]
MTTYLIRRLGHSLLSLIAITLVVYMMLNASGDPATLLLPDTASAEAIAQVRRTLGLDAPLYLRYFRFLGNAVTGDLGDSFIYRQPALDIVLAHVPATAQLAFAGMAVALLISIPLGVVAARNHGRAIDKVVLGIALLGQSVPVFWLGMLAIMVFSVFLGWLPTGGRGTIWHFVLPGLTLGWFANGLIARLVRSCMLEVLNQDYIRTAHSKGLADTVVVLKHALRNAAIPVVTVAGLQLAAMMGGTVVTEIVFAWPGVGRLTLDSISGRDYPVAMAAILFIAFVFIIVNFLVDMLYTMIDPRVKFE